MFKQYNYNSEYKHLYLFTKSTYKRNLILFPTFQVIFIIIRKTTLSRKLESNLDFFWIDFPV